MTKKKTATKDGRVARVPCERGQLASRRRGSGLGAAGGGNWHATERDAIDAVAELDDSRPVAGGGWCWTLATGA